MSRENPRSAFEEQTGIPLDPPDPDQRKGQRIQTIEQLATLAEQRKSVWYPNFGRPMPAAVVINMACSRVLRMIQSGLWEYKPLPGRNRRTYTYNEFPEIKIPKWLRSGSWEDHSWHNDAMAKSQRFLAYHPDGDPTHVVTAWVNFKDPNEREVPPRFMVEVARNRSEWDNMNGPTLYEGDAYRTTEASIRSKTAAMLSIHGSQFCQDVVDLILGFYRGHPEHSGKWDGAVRAYLKQVAAGDPTAPAGPSIPKKDTP